MTDASIIAPIALSFLDRANGVRLAYRFADGAGPLLVFLPGYMSDMEGGKAQAVFAHARERGRACLLLDYSGCGSSGGRFEDGTLDIWRDDVLALLDHVWPQGRIVPVGSSMGGWLALLVALARPDRISGLIGIAAAPDFTRWGFSDAQKAQLADQGRIVEPSEFGGDTITTLGFWKSGEANLLLDGAIALDVPVTLLHGQQDEVVPWEIAPRTAAALRSADVQTVLIKDGDHRLSRASDIAMLLTLVDGMLARS